jgi:hypothetical protein
LFSLSSFFVAIDGDYLSCHDLDLSGSNLASLVLAIAHNLPGRDLDIRGLGYNCWRSSYLWSWLSLLAIFLVVVLVATTGDPPKP